MSRTIKAPTGTTLTAKSWLTEAPLRMLMNNLDPEVGERPQDLVVYGGTSEFGPTEVFFKCRRGDPQSPQFLNLSSALRESSLTAW